MSQFDPEMWQDFVTEAEENLQELEPNLLQLEQDPTNRSLLNDCFRNMHSIKGAAGYMGLNGITHLAHAIETLFDRIRQGTMDLGENEINLAFSGTDRIRALIGEVAENHAESLDVSDLVAQIEQLSSQETAEASPPQEAQPSEPSTLELDFLEEGEDQELLSIFADEMASLYRQFEGLGRDGNVARHAVVDTLQDMERVTNYIGIEPLLEQLRALRSLVEEAEGEISPEDFASLVSELRSALSESGRIQIPEASEISEPGPEGEEEDSELLTIFLDFAAELAPPLARVPDEPDGKWIAECHDAVSRLKASAHYMDYPHITAILDEWEERLAETLSKAHDGGSFEPERLRELWDRLVESLPELPERMKAFEEAAPAEAADITPQGEGEDFVENLEAALDNLFEEESLWPENQGPEEGPAPPTEPAPTMAAIQPEPTPLERPTPEADQAEPAEPTAKTTQAAAPGATVRVDLEKVERIFGDVGELVILRSGLSQAAEALKLMYREWTARGLLMGSHIKPFKDLVIRLGEQANTLNRVARNLQNDVMQMRMLPVETLFSRYPRLIRDLSRKLGKKTDLFVTGAETALDKRVLEHMADPLMHIVRNALDHGIEPPEIREKLGKPATGRLELAASQEGNFVVLRIIDDGRGLDREALLRKAVSLGLIGRDAAQTLSDEKVWEFIFLPGVTTTESASETSGRGVGMDVVKKNVEQIGGSIRISSRTGQGTEFTVRIPLTLAIIPTLIVRVGRQAMAVPLGAVQETLRIERERIHSVEGFEVFSLRQETMPLIRLSRIFRGTAAEDNPDRIYVVVVRLGNVLAGLGVDVCVGQQEVVVKPLAEYLTDQPGFSGATILGDGSIALILDVPSLLDRAKGFIQRRQQILERAALDLPEATELVH